MGATLGVLGTVGATYAVYKLIFPWLGKDLHDMRIGLRIKKSIGEIMKLEKRPVDFFEEAARKHPSKPFIIFNDTVHTYGQISDEANRVANIAKTWNLKRGEVVALSMVNEPAFVSISFGLQKLGIPTALMNHHLRKTALTHSLKSVEAQIIISGSDSELLEALEDVGEDLRGIPIYVYGLPQRELPAGYYSLSDLILTAPSSDVGQEARVHTSALDHCIYVFTSGTTGLPKPAILNHIRACGSGTVVNKITGMTSEDVIYTTLPLYHSSGYLLGLLSVIVTGCTMLLRTKFSASHFWEDCRKHKVTVVQYIGELLRYLMTAPPSPEDGHHCVRAALGNGLRDDIWKEFQTRFKIPNIVELFAATEGSTLLVNLHNVPGACGRYSPLMRLVDPFPKYLVKYEPGTDQPVRDRNGRCIEVERGEPGLLLAAFPHHVSPKDIYKASQETKEKKLARDAFKEGDIYFNYGDVLYLDDNYFFHFTDRIGDTFRWKGENVSTLEVSNTLSSLDFIDDANVYGVEIPGQDGRAGMACLVLRGESTDLTGNMRRSLYSKCERSLPTYARPYFLRIQPEMDVTATHKQRKVNHVREGFDPDSIKYSLYFRDVASKTFVPLTGQLYKRIIAGQFKF